MSTDPAGTDDPLSEAEIQQLRLEIDRFQGRHDGLAVIGGQWQLRDGTGTLLAMDRS